ncbi:C-terminal processing protease CtpA/Prc, contains a PDZ domain [Sediminibacterium ginsengisoli]|uniref:Tricorn protease homolog n=2 Tax=Sediminibacterium ginsengisoli TaxID=413434 RepID=A0A1T4MLC9_9BACT|nr:C-terminal processing protease CtpA/Prc, contains a PDZ domain [Sediminibacterium ginsengisoli]
MAVLSGLQIFAQQNPSWMRYSAISPDGKTIVFTYKGDLYRVPAAGGNAVPLTLHEAHDFMPVWSHDGKSIAFASDRYGNFDVFVIPADGGEAKRVTYHSAAEYPYEFSADDKSILFGSSRMDLASNRTFPTGSQPELYKVSVNGGRVEQVLSTPAEDVKLSRNGQYLIYHDKKGGENTWRKHQTSAIARDIWVYDTKAGTHKKITSFTGEDRTPVFTDNDKAFYYLSEESGSFNVHKMSVDGGKSQQISTFKKHPVRFLSVAGDGTLCYSYDGELYTQKANGKPQKVAVAITADARSNNEKVVPVNSGARDLAVSPNGKEVAFIVRGEVFVSSVEGGVTKRITNTPEQERMVSFSPDGKTLLYASERGNSWKIFETKIVREEEPYFYASTLLKETPVVVNEKENYQPVYSPDGKEIAYIENRMTLRIYNKASKQTRTILTDKELFSMGDNDQYFQWSPDSKWILFDYAVPGIAPGEVGLVQADGKGKVINLTESGFNDSRAKWIMGGKAMLWFSNRDGLKSVAQSGGAQSDVYALFFTQDAFDRFKLSKEDAALLKDVEDNKAKADTSKKKEVKKDSVVIDWDALTTRKTKLTIHSSSLSDALVSKDGENLYYLARFEKGTNLWTTNLRTKETKMLLTLNAGGGSLVWDKDQKYMFLSTDGGISRIDPNVGKRDFVSINGEMLLNVAAERQFMFEHVWRRTKETFYTASMHGVNWDSYKADYEKYLPHIGNNYEFSEMLSELLGELNVSHSGSSYSNFSSGGDATASLGAFYDQSYKGAGVKIEEIIKDGPLDKAAISIKPGMIIEAIDGEAITADKDLAQYLNRKAGKLTLLSVLDGTTKKEITIKPVSLGEENGLLYKRWVKKNQDEVDKLSNGELGYVHIPGMNDGAYRTTYEEVMGKYAGRKGIVIDTRFNGGGDLVADLAMFLSGKKFMDYTTDNRSNGYEPNFRWTKPSISLANEANYSDGHCYAYTYQELKLGKLVGMPVPGTCTFAGWESLQDNSVRWGVPPLGCKDMKGQYLENHQTEPDIKLMNEYDVVIKGKDQQLEAAVNALLKEIK